MRWNYANGGYAEMANTLRPRAGLRVVDVSDRPRGEPGYVADIASTIDDYKINPPLPDSVFTQ